MIAAFVDLRFKDLRVSIFDDVFNEISTWKRKDLYLWKTS